MVTRPNEPELDFSGSAIVRLRAEELDEPLVSALADSLPEGANFGFNYESDGWAWVHVTSPHDTHRLIAEARRRLGRPAD